MDESRNSAGVGEAIFGIFLIFGILIILLYKFGGNNETVTNPETKNETGYLEEKLNNTEEDDIYAKYVKQIYDSQFPIDENVVSTTSLDEIVSNYEKELLEKVEIPNPTIEIKNVSDKFNPKYYSQNFEIIFEDLKKRDGTTEGQILFSQIGEGNTLLVLSDFDREKLIRIANEYSIFADKVSNLGTPTSVQPKALEIAVSAKKISYILEKIVEENDPKIYTLWISKYAENMSVIITDRYALQQL